MKGENLVSIEHNGEETYAKPKKTGLILSVIGGIWIVRNLVFMLIPPFFYFAFFASFIVSIVGPILGLNRKKGASLISLIGGILSFFAVLSLVIANGVGFVPFDSLILSGFMIMFLTIAGFGNFGIPAMLFLIGGIINFKIFYHKGGILVKK
jgi:hypothetical protein